MPGVTDLIPPDAVERLTNALRGQAWPPRPSPPAFAPDAASDALAAALTPEGES